MVARVQLILIALVLSLMSDLAHGSARVALLVGNDAYQSISPLENAKNDVRTVSAILERQGFEVDLVMDAGRDVIERRLTGFIEKIDPGDTALFYFAGHGVEISGENYLLPVDLPTLAPGPNGEGLVQTESVPLRKIVNRIRKKARLTIAIIDACRDNPLVTASARTIGARRGLAPFAESTDIAFRNEDGTNGTFVMYSAAAGQTALDGLEGITGSNSVFTWVFAKAIQIPGVGLPELARRIRKEVSRLARTANHDQLPAYYDEMNGNFRFLDTPTGATGSETTIAPPALKDTIAAQEWTKISGSWNTGHLSAFIDKYGDTPPGIEARERRDNVLGIVSDIQRNLNRLGFEAGKVDGLLGPKTKRAIVAFQTEIGVAKTGQPSELIRDLLLNHKPKPTSPSLWIRFVDVVQMIGSRVSDAFTYAFFAAISFASVLILTCLTFPKSTAPRMAMRTLWQLKARHTAVISVAVVGVAFFFTSAPTDQRGSRSFLGISELQGILGFTNKAVPEPRQVYEAEKFIQIGTVLGVPDRWEFIRVRCEAPLPVDQWIFIASKNGKEVISAKVAETSKPFFDGVCSAIPSVTNPEVEKDSAVYAARSI